MWPSRARVLVKTCFLLGFQNETHTEKHIAKQWYYLVISEASAQLLQTTRVTLLGLWRHELPSPQQHKDLFVNREFMKVEEQCITPDFILKLVRKTRSLLILDNT
eukprot:TRINITY_DN9075_c1_g1_i1.p1 TRINITY_DN9075_c1_g1~~TRINITY_DN9075_c1_g1_i1.p1  ORF type:complete len:105 (+),score=12.67 TRINITY_DN9075_c1_g1_i1:91-405(+)